MYKYLEKIMIPLNDNESKKIMIGGILLELGTGGVKLMG